MKKLLFAVLFLTAAGTFAQNATLRGIVSDSKTQAPLESATVYVTKAKDSAVIDYTITDRQGKFELITRYTQEEILLKVSYMGYRIRTEKINGIGADKDFGTLSIEADENTLGEVVIKTETPPVRVKNDTLEFNAASFKLRPDANVESLLKQLPGVEIDAEGKITVNGKEVNQILVNGKPFFDKDGKIALQNLPAEIINKVQVTDTKSKQEEISGQAASSDNASINLTIDEDKNKGMFGKATAGVGTEGRYESSLLFNYFKGDRKISVLGSSNNINSSGFSMDEIFDNMGGGRNRSVWASDDGSFGINGMQFGGGRGIKRTNIFGANYADVWLKKMDANTSYFYTGSITDNSNRTRQENLLPDGKLISESTAVTKDDSFAHNYNFEVEYKIDSTSTLSINPRLIKARNTNSNRFAQTTADEFNLLSESSGSDNSESDRTEFENGVYYYKSFRRKGRSLNVSFDQTHNDTDENELQISENTFFNDVDEDGIIDNTTTDNRNQIRFNRDKSQYLSGDVMWTEPITDSVSVSAALNIEHDSNSQNRRTFDFNTGTGNYDLFSDILSMYTKRSVFDVNPAMAININNKKLNMRIRGGTSIVDFNAQSIYLGTETVIDRKFLYPSGDFFASVSLAKNKNIYVNYSFDADMPQSMQILPIVDLSNPLLTISGNPEIKPQERHWTYLSFRNYDFATKSGYSIYGGGSYRMNQIVSSVEWVSGRRNLTYENVDDIYSAWFGGNWSKSIKRDAHSLKLTLSANGTYNRDKGFIEGEQFISYRKNIQPKINLNYDYGELLNITPSYRLDYTESRFTNYVIDRISNVVHTVMLQTTSYWPKHVVFGNDISYSYNSNIADGFRKDFTLWNISLGYNFLGDTLLAKIKVYDLLDQNQNATRNINAVSIRDEENTVLRRYAMFSLTYKLEKFGKKKESENIFFMD